VEIPGEPDFVKVLDFGISKMMASAHAPDQCALHPGNAALHVARTSPPAWSTEVDHRVDQWSLACIAWGDASRSPPFVADDVTALLFQIIKMDPHPLAPSVPGLRQRWRRSCGTP